jgi:hypothetical protein
LIAASRFGSQFPRFHDAPDSFEILGGIDADGGEGGFQDTNGNARGEGAELFELLRGFQGRRGKRDEAAQGLGPKGIEAVVVEVIGPGPILVAVIGNGMAGEIQGVTPVVRDDLDNVRIGGVFLGLHPAHQGGHLDLRFSFENFDQLADGGRLDERLVPLEVDHQARSPIPEGFRATVRTAAAVFRRHDRMAAEPFHRVEHAGVIGGDEDFVHGLGPLRPAINPLDHGLSADVHQRLSRQACGGVPGGDDADSIDCVHAILSPVLVPRAISFRES